MNFASEFELLISRAATGEQDAAWQLADAYTPHILRVVRRSLNPQLRQKLDSVDIAQTIWASILLCPSELTRFSTPEQLIAFLSRATRNRVIDKARHFGTRKCDVSRALSIEEYGDNSEGRIYSRDPTPSHMASLRERWQRLLESCTEQERQILALREGGVTFEEIGNKLSISRDRARRVVNQLATQFEQ
jgi:RNA polymerase sigma factor (sigma-70 family)